LEPHFDRPLFQIFFLKNPVIQKKGIMNPLQPVSKSHFKKTYQICRQYIEGVSQPIVEITWMYKGNPILRKVYDRNTGKTEFFAVSKSLSYQATCGHPITDFQFGHDAGFFGNGFKIGWQRCGKCEKTVKEYASYDALLNDFSAWLQDISTQPDCDNPVRPMRITKREARLILKAIHKSKGL
jgi:hypothetical protein